MSFGTLAAIVAAGLVGPLLSGISRVPTVVGELLAGVAIGATGFGWVDASEPSTALLGQIGFAVLMFSVGMHLPLHDRSLRRAASRGLVGAGIVALLAIPASIGVSALTTGLAAPVVWILLATGSAAIVAPILREQGLDRGDGLVVLAQVTAADIITIVALPLALEPARAPRAAIASVVVALAAVAVLAGAFSSERVAFVVRMRALSKRQGWALDLRLALLALFALSWLALEGGTSILIAGFSAGLIVAVLGGPKRLSRQVTGVADGLFIPLFFVVLGARLDLRALVSEDGALALLALLVAGNVVVHLAGAVALRIRAAAGLVATAQLGVPAAIVALGATTGTIRPAVGAAIMAGALVSLAVCSVGARLLSAGDPSAPGPSVTPGPDSPKPVSP
ncbi:MAG: cation:proton antiporter [Actinobacteria bacterium]|nr:cation:proton antiporter [Actinomycetota bacterium]